LISPAYSRLDPRTIEKLRNASRSRVTLRPASGEGD
jgi:hypothetical protein